MALPQTVSFGWRIGVLAWLCLLWLADEGTALSIRRSTLNVKADASSDRIAAARGQQSRLALRKGSRGRSRRRRGDAKGKEGHANKAYGAKQGENRLLPAGNIATAPGHEGVGRWHDVPYGHFRPSFGNGAATAPGNKTTPQDDPTGLAPALAPGVTNALGEGFDPQFLTVPLGNGSQLFVTPDVNFGLQAFLRASTDLNDIYRDEAKNHVIFNYSSTDYPEGVGTEAADITPWDGGRFLYTVSAVADDTMRALLSRTQDVLGEYEDLGRITHNGTALKGFDPHVIVHPNGKKYLTWSNHEYVQIVELTSANTADGPIVNLVSYGVNTEAPTSWFYPNRINGSQTLNLAYAEGNFYQSNYNTRVLFQDVSSDPLDPAQWYQRGASTLSSSSSRGVFGPGSGSFFRGPDGQTWFGYGAFDDQDGAEDGKNDRFVRVQVAAADDKGVWIPTQVVETPKTY
ncbi:uncharacterized protein PFL1_02378 [Pseudozyma flocculosa PF-1]|uniref:Glycoside hydrolase family 43 protein n=1 Tax=Pseudozyma flocculosa TaxID=84751 RepID=A0A5C3F8W0_9BASI|nr:uncharacterized protein PFL1_02378 [Pseudozyma flocculosa PF-1]EPQ30262.1 hypothetical protein PFL1_02378 [Pseudozyma flocculosa PF-1]SPO39801.1 uncharacterized protein PSFLO_05282 [Pseudozyma flocculosa]